MGGLGGGGGGEGGGQDKYIPQISLEKFSNKRPCINGLTACTSISFVYCKLWLIVPSRNACAGQ